MMKNPLKILRAREKPRHVCVDIIALWCAFSFHLLTSQYYLLPLLVANSVIPSELQRVRLNVFCRKAGDLNKILTTLRPVRTVQW